MRPTFHEFYLAIALAASARGECTRSKVGAILVKVDPYGSHMTSIGYNGTHPGTPSCLTGNCPRGLLSYTDHPSNPDYSDCIAFHAEDNAMANATFDFHGGTMYVTREPCSDCHNDMAQMGIKKSIWPGGTTEYASGSKDLSPRTVYGKSS